MSLFAREGEATSSSGNSPVTGTEVKVPSGPGVAFRERGCTEAEGSAERMCDSISPVNRCCAIE